MAPEAVYEVALGGATLRVRVWAASDVGRVRAANEDSLLAAVPVSLVADGMGGHALGDRASQTVVETFESLFAVQEPTTVTAVVSAISRAHAAVVALTAGGGGDARSVAGTTLAGVALVSGPSVRPGDDPGCRWMIFNVGDSRVYGWDGSVLSQLTVDHSAVQYLVDRGLITREEAARHPQRNVITRAIGVDGFSGADVWLSPLDGRQAYLLCSDGLTKELDDEAIARVLRDPGDDPAERLVAAALRSGGTDNVTVVVLESELTGAVAGAGASGDAFALEESLEDTLPRHQRS